jgi:hypothetical protein
MLNIDHIALFCPVHPSTDIVQLQKTKNRDLHCDTVDNPPNVCLGKKETEIILISYAS